MLLSSLIWERKQFTHDMFGTPQYKNLFEMLPTLGEHTGYIDSIIDVDYPHISKKIILMWGSNECVDYIESLINYSHSHDRPMRQGFPLQALLELQFVLDEHVRQFPYMKSELMKSMEDPWRTK